MVPIVRECAAVGRMRVCEKTYYARDLAFRRYSESSCISIYTPVARPILGTRPCGACTPFRSRRNGPALRRNATSLRSQRFFHKLLRRSQFRFRHHGVCNPVGDQRGELRLSPLETPSLRSPRQDRGGIDFTEPHGFLAVNPRRRARGELQVSVGLRSDFAQNVSLLKRNATPPWISLWSRPPPPMRSLSSATPWER